MCYCMLLGWLTFATIQAIFSAIAWINVLHR
jgi:hypothetical protein